MGFDSEQASGSVKERLDYDADTGGSEAEQKHRANEPIGPNGCTFID